MEKRCGMQERKPGEIDTMDLIMKDGAIHQNTL